MEGEKQKKFKEDVLKELDVKETLIKKLAARNRMLELLIKKSVKIMQNPQVMKDAFRRFNFNKYVYTKDGHGNVECELMDSDAGSERGDQ